jgi:hypothetical protein
MALGPLPDAAQIVLATMKGTHNDWGWQNKLYLQYTGTAPAVADLQSVGTSIGNAWNTNIAPMCHANVTMAAVDLVDLTNRAASIASVTGLAHPGTRAGTDPPNSVAAVVSWKINHRYRGGHGRTYFPAGVQADYTNGRLWTTAFTTAMNNAATAFRTALNAITVSGQTYRLVIMNFITHDPVTKVQHYVIPPVPYTVQGNVVHGRVDTQRRRLGKETP